MGLDHLSEEIVVRQPDPGLHARWSPIDPAALPTRLLGDDLVAEPDALVADEDTRTGDQLGDVLLALAAAGIRHLLRRIGRPVRHRGIRRVELLQWATGRLGVGEQYEGDEQHRSDGDHRQRRAERAETRAEGSGHC